MEKALHAVFPVLLLLLLLLTYISPYIPAGTPSGPTFFIQILCKPKGDGGIATVFFSDTNHTDWSVYLSPLKNSERSESVAYIVAFSPMTRYVPTTPGSFPVSFVAPVRSVRVQEPSGTRSPEDNATADHALLTALSDGTENLFFFPIKNLLCVGARLLPRKEPTRELDDADEIS